MKWNDTYNLKNLTKNLTIQTHQSYGLKKLWLKNFEGFVKNLRKKQLLKQRIS